MSSLWLAQVQPHSGRNLGPHGGPHTCLAAYVDFHPTIEVPSGTQVHSRLRSFLRGAADAVLEDGCGFAILGKAELERRRVGSKLGGERRDKRLA